MTIYTVQPGDSIYSIAKKYNIPMQKILNDNRLTADQPLVVGQVIVLLTEGKPYTVKSGDTLYSIGRRFNTSVDRLLAANPDINDAARIFPGQVVFIPADGGKMRSIEVNGYALPGITADTLNSTLPYLTYISPFSYMVRADGSLSELVDLPIIDPARRAGVAPWMVISNMQEGQGFSSTLAHTILTNDTVQDALLNNVLNIMNRKRYTALDIDFEYIFPQDRENYNRFLRKVTERLHPLGYKVSTALAPKLSAAQQGLLYEAHDYPVHGQLADHIILMTYEWGYT